MLREFIFKLFCVMPIPLICSCYEVHDYHIMHPYYWKQVLCDTKAVIMAPACWDRQDLMIAGLVIGGTLALMPIDKRITNSLSNDNSLHGFFAVTNNFGDECYLLPALAGVYVLGEAFHSRKARKIALLSGEGILIAGGLAQIGKYLFHRQRPRSKHSSPYHWDGPYFRNHHVSFPSGHTACAFAVAAVITEELKDRSILIPITAYSLATLTGISRIERRDHWASDVFFGACLGLSVGKFIARLHPDCPCQCWEVDVSPQPGGAQVSLGRSF